MQFFRIRLVDMVDSLEMFACLLAVLQQSLQYPMYS